MGSLMEQHLLARHLAAKADMAAGMDDISMPSPAFVQGQVTWHARNQPSFASRPTRLPKTKRALAVIHCIHESVALWPPLACLHAVSLAKLSASTVVAEVSACILLMTNCW